MTAGETQNADLFWGVRGGGGNFGIVVDLQFRLNRSDQRSWPARFCGQR